MNEHEIKKITAQWINTAIQAGWMSGISGATFGKNVIEAYNVMVAGLVKSEKDLENS